jgi:hypothetical protein
MTDLDRFIGTYKQFGIDVNTSECDDKIVVYLNGDTDNSTKSDKFDGYQGFLSDIEFTKEGKFLRQGFWE